MRITERAEYVWSSKQEKYLLVKRKSIIWTHGQIAFAKGASAAQNNLASQQASFYGQLQNDYSQQFGAQTNILSSLQNSL